MENSARVLRAKLGGRPLNDAAATVLETRTHVKGDRDFLFGFLRELARTIRWVSENPEDRASVGALQRDVAALLAFGLENNIQAGTRARRTPGNGV